MFKGKDAGTAVGGNLYDEIDVYVQESRGLHSHAPMNNDKLLQMASGGYLGATADPPTMGEWGTEKNRVLALAAMQPHVGVYKSVLGGGPWSRKFFI